MFIIIVPTQSHNKPVCADWKARVADGVNKKNDNKNVFNIDFGITEI